jgi:trans-AT polyketide synthase/acyltransferase/oxidoreductase domain-containing protein
MGNRMVKRVIMFPGQGSQFKGMGSHLFQIDLNELILAADEILGYSIVDLCLQDRDQKLDRTEFTQPALYVVNALSYHAHFKEGGSEPDYVAGHSLGEINALNIAGAFSFIDGLRLVKKRSALMSSMETGGMAAIIGMNRFDVENLLKERATEVDIANINADNQVIISGNCSEIARLKAEVLNHGAKAYVPLKVSGAFHSRFMGSARDRFRNFIDGLDFSFPKIPVMSNLLGRPYPIGKIKDVLADQISNPVNWVGGIQYLRKQGVSEFLELGPGKVLTNLMKHIQ